MNKYLISVSIILMSFTSQLKAQTFLPVGNTEYIGLDKNLLFNATSRYQVTQTGTRQFDLPALFNGSFFVEYLPGFDGSPANGVVIEIAGLPAAHTQNGAFIGFTTRGFPAKSFKIEGFESYSANAWQTIAEVNNNTKHTYTTLVPNGAYSKIRYTFLKGSEELPPYAGYLGLSELFFVHNEAAKAYDGLMVQYSPNGNVGLGTTVPGAKLSFNDVNDGSENPSGITWYSPTPLEYGIYRSPGSWVAPNYQQLKLKWDTGITLDPGVSYGKSYVDIQGGGLRVTSGELGIGTTNTKGYKLAVNGKIRAHEIKVETSNWPDYVFAKDYNLPPLQQTEQHIKEKGHLPGIPSAAEVKANGVDLGEMNAKLLQKIEELTLHLIEKDKEIKRLDKLNDKIAELDLKIENLIKKQ